MKLKNGINLIWAFLLVSSIFSVMDIVQGEEINNSQFPIDVSKKVWNGCSWVETFDTYYGEMVRFNVTITYHKNCGNGQYANDIKVIDVLPSFLKYANNATYEENSIDGNLIYWNLTEKYGIILYDGKSVSIEFDTEVIEYGDGINHVEVNAFEPFCGNCLRGVDDVELYIVDAISVDKEVYDPEIEEWVDEYLGSVKKVDPVKFRITITYYGYYNIELMKCMVVENFLPGNCLSYIEGSENFIYPEGDFHDPDIIISPSLDYVIYNWENKKFNLFVGESLIIEYEASVSYYCYKPAIDSVYIEAYSCLGCPDSVILTDSDYVVINCYPPNSAIDKKVWDPNLDEWVEEISVYIDDTVRFRIDLTYYGNYNLSEISILDQLHPSMEFAGNANPPISGVSGKSIWWNFTEYLDDCSTISIEFDALAVGGTGIGAGFNMVFVTAYEDNQFFDDSDIAGVIVFENLPPCNPDINGDDHGIIGEELTFYTVTCDPDGDDVYYKFDFGNGTTTEWLGPFSSCQETMTSYSWVNAGTYYVKSKAKDASLGYESEWSHYPVEVIIVEPPLLSLNITIKSGLGLSVYCDIENNGELDLDNVDYNLQVVRLGIFQKTLLDKSGTIPSLAVGDIEKISGSPQGAGFIRVILIVEAPGIDTIQVSKDGFIFYRFVWIK